MVNFRDIGMFSLIISKPYNVSLSILFLKIRHELAVIPRGPPEAGQTPEEIPQCSIIPEISYHQRRIKQKKLF